MYKKLYNILDEPRSVTRGITSPHVAPRVESISFFFNLSHSRILRNRNIFLLKSVQPFDGVSPQTQV